jgi:DnaJ-class molecular chaperone
MTARDAFEVLGVPATSSDTEIRMAFKGLSLRWHPDKATDGNRDAATARFREICDAYQAVSTAALRAQYARTRATRPGGFAGRRPPTSKVDRDNMFDDFFEEVAGDARGWAARGAQKLRSEDMCQVEVACTVADIIRGAHKVAHAGNARCTVWVPPGTADGTHLSCDVPGVVMVVRYAPDERFRRDGDNVHTTVTLALRSALIVGTEFWVDTPLGERLRERLRAVAHPEATHLVPNHGMSVPGYDGKKRGALVVHFRVLFPPALSVHQREVVGRLFPAPEPNTDATVVNS